MTEAEWLASGVPSYMLGSLLPIESDRKLRLFGVTATRLLGSEHWHPTVERAMQVAEQFADGEVTDASLGVALSRVYSDALAAEIARSGLEHARTWANQANYHIRLSPGLADLVRDIFGNPFRPATFASDWRPSTTIATAKGMYESRDFSAMPILADALQDAGCEDESVLNHCRDEKKVHVRGCWVVDLVLGKE